MQVLDLSQGYTSLSCWTLIALADLGGRAGVAVKNIPTPENIPSVCFHVQSYVKSYPPDGRLVCGNVTFDSM